MSYVVSLSCVSEERGAHGKWRFVKIKYLQKEPNYVEWMFSIVNQMDDRVKGNNFLKAI